MYAGFFRCPPHHTLMPCMLASSGVPHTFMPCMLASSGVPHTFMPCMLASSGVPHTFMPCMLASSGVPHTTPLCHVCRCAPHTTPLCYVCWLLQVSPTHLYAMYAGFFRCPPHTFMPCMLASSGVPKTGRMHQIRVHLQWLGKVTTI